MLLKSVAWWGLSVATLIAGCGSGQAPAAAENSGSAYELVLLQKPDSVDNYVKVERGVYDLCVTSAQVNHTTAKPFPTLPASLGTTRSTYLIRGRDRVVREEMLGALDLTKNTVDHQCEVDVTPARTLHVDLVVGVTHTSIDTDDNGQPLVQTEDITDLRGAQAGSRAPSTAKYTDPVAINGVDLRCLPKDKPPIDGEQLQQMCVYARDGVLVEPDGKPIVLASRVRLTPGRPLIIKEPQSLRTIEHPDASQFTAAAYTR